jgi:mRNA interferase MazF
VTQGEIYRVNLDPVVGHEIGGENLVAIVSNNTINNSFLPLTVVPLVGAAGTPLLVFSALVPAAESGLSLDVVANCLQVRVLDQSRFTGAPEGALSPTAMKAVEKALHKVFHV